MTGGRLYYTASLWVGFDATRNVAQLRQSGTFPFGPYSEGGELNTTVGAWVTDFLGSIGAKGISVHSSISVIYSSTPFDSNGQIVCLIEPLVLTRIYDSSGGFVSQPAHGSLLLIARQRVNQTGGTVTSLRAGYNAILPPPLDNTHWSQLWSTIGNASTSGSFLLVPPPIVTVHNIVVSFNSGDGASPAVTGRVRTYMSFRWLSTPYGPWGVVSDETTSSVGAGSVSSFLSAIDGPAWFIELTLRRVNADQTNATGVMTVDFDLIWP